MLWKIAYISQINDYFTAREVRKWWDIRGEEVTDTCRRICERDKACPILLLYANSVYSRMNAYFHIGFFYWG